MTNILGPEWRISPEGINIITENGTITNPSKILQNALDTDLKEIGSVVLASELSKPKTSKIVLQIQKIRNISAPKANESSQAAPRMLKLILTDGESNAQALEIQTINSLHRDRTAPGSKLLINEAKIVSGYIQLTPSNCSLLGGKVPHMYEKWELTKSVYHNNRQSSQVDGPPAWVNFGCKIASGGPDQNFKSLENKNKDSAKNNSEFELQRQGAIAEATTGAIRKVFGGGMKTSVQQNNSNSVKRPESNSNNRINRDDKNKNQKGKNLVKDTEEKLQKPSEKVSLFDFLEDKLPVTAPQVNNKSYNSTSDVVTNSSSHLQNNNYQSNKNYPSYNKSNNYTPRNQQNQYQQPQHHNNYNQYHSGNWNRKEGFQNNYQKPQRFDNNRNNFQNNRYNDRSKNDSKNEQKVGPNPPQNTSNNKFISPEPVPQHSSNNGEDKSINELTNNMSKASLNSQFASRSLRQHLNLATTKKPEHVVNQAKSNVDSALKLNDGDDCMAKYWEDDKYYTATVIGTTDKTYVVKYKGYGNIEEVLKTDCTALPKPFPNNRFDQKNNYSGSVEFRRSGRSYN